MIVEILGLNKLNQNIIVPITAQVAIIVNSILIKKLGTQLSLLDVKTVVTNVKYTSIKARIDLLSGLAVLIFANPVAYMTGSLVV